MLIFNSISHIATYVICTNTQCSLHEIKNVNTTYINRVEKSRVFNEVTLSTTLYLYCKAYLCIKKILHSLYDVLLNQVNNNWHLCQCELYKVSYFYNNSVIFSKL